MPIVRVGGGLVYYAHVPKCAGASVETYLSERFGTLAFLNSRYRLVKPPGHRWSRTSPQHIDAGALKLLFPDGFFRASFGVVRHPATRLRSSYLYERQWNRVRPGQSFESWLNAQARTRGKDPFAGDNHFRPMDDMVPKDAAVFRVEDGLMDLVEWLDALAEDTVGPREIPHTHHSTAINRAGGRWRKRLAKLLDPPAPALDERLCNHVHRLYSQDYERFGYGIFDPLEATAK